MRRVKRPPFALRHPLTNENKKDPAGLSTAVSGILQHSLWTCRVTDWSGCRAGVNGTDEHHAEAPLRPVTGEDDQERSCGGMPAQTPLL